MKTQTKTQWQQIDAHLEKKPITSYYAAVIYGITRLAEIVRQVEKNTGKTVMRKWIEKNGKHFKEYYYEKKA